jgi:flavin-dependent dehydrogenase
VQNHRGEWKLSTNDGNELQARILVGADGRNSTVARLLGLLPRATRERVALQAHVVLPARFGARVVLQFLPGGYCGQAPVNERELNICLVGRAETLPSLREWAANRFELPRDQQWRTITPLSRRPIRPARRNLFFVGDSARVVEPFTGEGISYAINSGEIAAIVSERMIAGLSPVAARAVYRRAFVAMYRGRSWINALARTAVISPNTGSFLFALAQRHPEVLRRLTRTIVG